MNLIAEIGINHNGDIEICKNLIFCAKQSGFNYVKIQKRNPDKCVPEEQKNKMRETPWGTMTYLEYKKKIEFNDDQIKELLRYANEINITMFASVWDIDSADLMAKYTKIGKIPSALITDLELCAYSREKFDTLIISTGMSTEDEIETCVQICSPNVVMHSNSTYPCPPEDLNLRYITWLKDKYSDREIGYSGHETGIAVSLAAVSLGATSLERHITLDHNMWGTDHKSSLEVHAMDLLKKRIKDVNKMLGGTEKIITPSEEP